MSSNKLMEVIKKYKTFFETLLVFAFFSVLFLIIHTQIDHFLGVDAYYHSVHSKISFLKNKLHYTEPWIKLHFFNYSPLDPYFIFHYIGGFFISIFNTVLGFKIFGALLSASVFAVFYWILSELKVKHKLLWLSFLFLGSFSFIHRLLLIRSFIFSITLLLLAYYLLHERKYLLFLILSTFYTLYYSLFVFLIPLSICFIIYDYWDKRNINLKPLLYNLAGISLGLLIHPTTLKYITYVKTQLIDVFYLKITGINIPTGNEIDLGSIDTYLANYFLPLLIIILASAIFLSFYQTNKKLRKLTPLFLFTYMWLIISIFIPRGIEYFIPFSILTAALVFNRINYNRLEIDKIKNKLTQKKQRVLLLLACVLIFGYVGFKTYSLTKTITEHNKNLNLEQYKQASNYLKDHTDKNSTIFYSNWSYFPKLFFFNQNNQYISGFDPVFAYKYNKDVYRILYNISLSGVACNKKAPCFPNMKNHKTKLKYSFLQVLETENILLKKEADKKIIRFLRRYKDDYKKIFENDVFVIYKVKK